MALPTPEPDPLPAPRGQPQQPPPNIGRIDAQLPASSAFMRGLSDLDVILSRGPNDNAAAAIGNTLQHPELLQRLLDGGSVAVPRDTRPEHFANDYDPRWFLFTHPEVFPNGTGACPKGMSLDAWGQLLLRRWYPFDDPGISPYFLIDLYDVWARHEVSRMTYVKLQLTSASTIESIGTLTYEETAQVINLLRRGLMGAALSTELAKLPQGARHLFECFKFVNGRVRGTPWAFRSLRAHYLGGAWLAWGPPTMSLNLNPSPLDSHIVFYLAGRPYKFSRDGVPEGRPDIVQRWRLIATNPQAAAAYFKLFISAVCDVLLGWPPGAAKQANSDCPFGHVLAWFFKYESNQAGDLHAHGCIWQAELASPRLHDVLAADDTARRLTSFLENLSCAFFVQPEHWARDVFGPGFDVVNHAGEFGAPEDRILRRRGDEHYATACLPPLALDLRTEATRLMAQGQIEKNLHRHTGTCAERGGAPTDEACRLGWPRRKIRESEVLPNSRGILLKRAGAHLVNCTPALMLAQPCNHFVYPMVEVSRWLRQLELWQNAHPDTPSTDPSAPQLPDQDALASDVGEYALKYGTKEDSLEASAPYLESTALLQERLARRKHEREGGPAPGSPEDLAGFNIRHACNQAQAAITQSAAETALSVSGSPSFVESHEFCTQDLGLFANFTLQGQATVDVAAVSPRFARPRLLAAPDAATPEETASSILAPPPTATIAQTAAWEAYARVPAPVFDYLYRGNAVRHLAPILLSMWCYLAHASNTEHAAQHNMRLHPYHPQSERDIWHLYRRPHIAQLLRDPPPRPVANTSAADKEIYAAYVLANFWVYDLEHPLPSYGGLWTHLQALLAEAAVLPADATTLRTRQLRVLVNYERHMADRAATRNRSHARQERHQAASNANDATAAAAALLQRDPRHVADDRNDTSEADADALLEDAYGAIEEGDFDEAAILQQAAETTRQDVGAVLASMRSVTSPQQQQQLETTFLGCHGAPVDTRTDAYLRPALRTLTAATASTTPPATQLQPLPSVRSAADLVFDVHALSQQLATFKQAAASAPAAPTDTGQPAPERLTLHRDTRTGDLQLQLHVFPPDTLGGDQLIRTIAPTEEPPYVRLPADQLPSPEDTARIFRLDDEQRPPFLKFAYTLLAEARGRSDLLPPPLLGLIPAPAGAGKSHCIMALEWFAFQHSLSEMLAISSYTWRGALQITTPSNTGMSTTTLFGLGDRKRRGELTGEQKRKLQNRLCGVRLLIIDEAYFIGLPHLAGISSHVRMACDALQPGHPYPLAPFGYMHCLIAGDMRQHLAPFAVPLYAAAETADGDEDGLKRRLLAAIATATGSPDTRKLTEASAGHRVYRQFREVYPLTRQYRLDKDEQHRQNVMLFDGRTDADPTAVRNLLEDLQARTMADLPARLTRAVILRHRVQVGANRLLALHHSRVTGQHIFIWRSIDVLSSTHQPPPPELAAQLDNDSFDNTGDIPTINFFFPGCLYVFGSSDAPALHIIANNTATGVGIIPAAPDAEALLRAPPDCRLHVLRRPPDALIVRPDGAPLPRTFQHPSIPEGCVPVFPITRKFPYPPRNRGRTTGAAQHRLERFGYELQDAYAPTDFLTQGMTFSATNTQWAAHLTPPPDGNMHRASLYVVLSRFSTREDIRLLAPLWRPGAGQDEKEGVVRTFVKLAKRVPAIAAEIARLDTLAEETRALFPAALQGLQVTAGLVPRAPVQ
ncbi:hypothetical protein PLESTF_001816800 [Pleodorina starrii]|nr:hypothetical protein PLESTM_000975700 [Pleodorina starrii]GLC76684.1 hypothetical protein PLESTF_001816800 [Pleodorina starrii]